jgi:hypothetical protein
VIDAARAMYCELTMLGLIPGNATGSFWSTRVLSSRVPTFGLDFSVNNHGDFVAVERGFARGFALLIPGIAMLLLGLILPLAYKFWFGQRWSMTDSITTGIILTVGLCLSSASALSLRHWRRIRVSRGEVQITWHLGHAQIFSSSFRTSEVQFVTCEMRMRTLRGSWPTLHGLLLVTPDQTVALAIVSRQRDLLAYADQLANTLGIQMISPGLQLTAQATETTLGLW